MISVGEMVVYGKNGVCTIKEIVTKKLGNVDNQYYVLEPVYKRGLTFFVPVGQEEGLRVQGVLSHDEIFEFIRSMPEIKEMDFPSDKIRREEFEALLTRGERRDLVSIIKTYYRLEKSRLKSHKKLSSKDEMIYSKAQKILYDEFAAVLDIAPEQVVPFIENEIELSEK